MQIGTAAPIGAFHGERIEPLLQQIPSFASGNPGLLKGHSGEPSQPHSASLAAKHKSKQPGTALRTYLQPESAAVSVHSGGQLCQSRCRQLVKCPCHALVSEERLYSQFSTQSKRRCQ